MRKLTLALLVFAFAVPALAGQSDDQISARLTARDQTLLKEHAIFDADARAIWARVDRALPPPAAAAPADGCIDSCVLSCQGGAGSLACWNKCNVEGYSSSVCAPRCGVTTAAGSQACWSKCGTEGYSSQVCADRCGTATPAGSTACWNKCTTEGYSSSVCAPRCGTTTQEGSEACWRKCTVEGYSSTVCVARCGNS